MNEEIEILDINDEPLGITDDEYVEIGDLNDTN